MSNTANELAMVIEYVEAAGWTRLNGNTWQNPVSSRIKLSTAYTFGEATITVYVDEPGNGPTPVLAHFRGPHPVMWVCDVLSKVKGMDFAVSLADRIRNA